MLNRIFQKCKNNLSVNTTRDVIPAHEYEVKYLMIFFALLLLQVGSELPCGTGMAK